jgi:hypothetical protein
VNRLLARLGLAVVVALPLAACGAEPADTDLSGVDVEVMDCDAEDKRKKEVPDCGRYVKGKFVAWSWVSKGSKPPAGWSPAREPAVSSSKPAPKTTSRKATSDKTTVTDGRSRRTTTNRNSGTTRRR